jgi:hypothetical protein
MITQDELKEILMYDKKSGIFVWVKVSKSKNYLLGKEAGIVEKDGYVRISINKKRYPAHRLAWLYENGKMPRKDIDHINHNRADNRIKNLRLVTKRENAQNASKGTRNKSGVTGVSWSKDSNRWKAQISIDGKSIMLGRYSNFSDAVNARKNAEILYGYHANHGK